MRVIVTRASVDAERTATALRARGHEALLSPVLEIAPTDAAIHPETAQALVATSAHAFDALSSGEAAKLLHLPLFVVGARTSKAAQRIGLTPPSVIAARASELASQMVALLPTSARVLYLAGRDRKPDLEKALAHEGFTIDAEVVYEACAIEALSPEVAAALKQGEADAVLHFSRRSARLFMDCVRRAGLSAEVAALRHICISQDVAAEIGAASEVAKIPEVAKTPDGAGLLKALEQM